MSLEEEVSSLGMTVGIQRIQIKQLEAENDAKQQEINGLEDALQNCEEALAVSADMLLTYKDYYGTSVAQVKHLTECGICIGERFGQPLTNPCPDYPSE